MSKPLSSFESDADFLRLENQLDEPHSSAKLESIAEYFEGNKKYDQAALYYTLSARKGNNELVSWILDILDDPTDKEITKFYYGINDIFFKNRVTQFGEKLLLSEEPSESTLF